MDSNRIFKRLLAVILLCIYCSMPVLGLAVPVFPDSIVTTVHDNCGPQTFYKSGSPQRWHASFDSIHKHKVPWSQQYRSKKCDGVPTVTRYEYENHVPSRYLRHKVSDAYITEIWYCNVCCHEFPIVKLRDEG